ncbi:MAG: HIT domain-containing protein [Deltaproteobacteria bacterium]|nr:HIT domain-containing protein [Deltaproteobacteria bacterium]
MENLWAPWRLEYIQGPDSDDCIFCLGESRSEDETRLILVRGQHCFVIMNRYPYSNGHLMVAPIRHVSRHAEIDDVEAVEIHRYMVACQDVLTETCQAQGFNVGWNIGLAAGAGVADHLHLHIVPRWPGDTNFMPVLADIRVIPEHLLATYRLLRKAFESHEINNRAFR